MFPGKEQTMTGSILSQLLDPIKNADAKPAARASVYLYNHLKHIEGELIRQIEDCLGRNRVAIVLYVSLERYQQLYPVDYGQLADSIVGVLKAWGGPGLGSVCGDAGLLYRESLWEDDFLMVLEVGRSLDLAAFTGHDAVSLVKLNKRLNDEVSKTFGNSFSVRVGYSSILGKTDYLKSQIHDAIVKARKLIKHYVNLKTNHLPAEFRDLIGRSAFDILYQPIVSLRTGHALGWESLIRGPKGSYFHDAESIFCFAEDAGLLQDIETLSWRLAMRNAGELGPEQKLFLNVHPRSFETPVFMEEAIRLVERAGLSPQKIVIEITERHDIADLPKFRKILKACRDAGFLIAVDDVGSGFSCLQAIAEIRPDFIKLSNSLVQGLHQDRARFILLETFATFAEKIGCAIIAEGIENEADLKSLTQIGIQLGQGYFLHVPASPKPAVETRAQEVIRRTVGDSPNNLWKYPLIIGEIAREAVTVDENEKVRDVKDYFERNENIDGLVVTAAGVHRGLIMRHHLDRHLGTRYGVALYFDKPIRKLMDETPLVVKEDATIDAVAQMAMNRERLKHNDYIVVGPAADPAKVGGLTDAAAAMKKIAGAKSPFASRGDNSGTHVAEKALWKAAGVDAAGASGGWYRETGSGMGATLNTAVGMSAYALTDRGTWISFKNKGDYKILVEGDSALFNQYGIMLVNPQKHPKVKAKEGQAFIDWILGAEGQQAIAGFKLEGQPLFFPNARK